MAYASLEPFGGVRDDKRAGTIASMLYNVNRQRGAEALSWYDLFPNVESPKVIEALKGEDRKTVEQSCNNIIGMFKGFNKRWDAKKAVKAKG